MHRITENSWDCLLTQIDRGNVAVILGNELYFVEDEDGTVKPLEKYMLQEMCAELEIDFDDNIDFDRLCDYRTRILWEEIDSSPYYWAYKRLTKLKAEGRIIAPEISKILSIKKFDIVITTAITDIASQIMQEQYEDIFVNVLQYEKGSNRPDCPLNSNGPYFYQMFGNICPIDYKFVLTEDDLLSFMHNWLDKGRHPENLVNRLAGKYILAIGCNYPNWLFRFFFHSMKENCPDRGKSGMVINSNLDKQLTRFLSRKKMDTHYDASKFITELLDRWNTFSQRKQIERKEIFISYASEDYNKAKEVANLFEKNGRKVWFDKKSLIPGEDYETVIRSHIENCEGFIPIISSNTPITGSRFYEKEWVWAFETADRKGISPDKFIFPLMIDELDYNSIPPIFRNIHIGNFNHIDTDKELMIQKIRRAIIKAQGYGN